MRKRVLEGVRDGLITLAFRRWRRPTVRSGSTLLTSIGQLAIRDVRAVSIDEISPLEAKRAGFESRDELLAELSRRPNGEVYRIEFGGVGADPRVTLRESPVSDDEFDELVGRLAKLDARAKSGPWTMQTLEALRVNPETRAREVCQRLGQQQETFKRNVRKLKALGLTESLGTGYRLSVRGSSFLRRIGSEGRADV